MFESARLKLTLFYLAILCVFSLMLTWGLRAMVQAEFNRANDAQRGAVHEIGLQFFTENPPRLSDRRFARIQDAQAQETQDRLNRQTIILNIAVLAIGGVLSYWYAGRALRPLQEIHEKQKRFTADASHELRTPLASLKLENELFLRQKSFADKEVRAQIASNLEEVARLERLTTSLLDLSRYEGTTLAQKKLSIKSLADEAVANAKHAELAKEVTFKTQVAKANVLGDHASLVQLLGILLDNAVKYGPRDGRVEITGAPDDGEYLLTIRDHGAGIAAADLPHIFERMYRGDKARSNTTSGHGIGLSLASQIALANGLQLWADNHPEGGAVFSIRFAKG